MPRCATRLTIPPAGPAGHTGPSRVARPLRVIAAVLGLSMAVASLGLVAPSPAQAGSPTLAQTPGGNSTATPAQSAAVRLFGTPRSGLPWHSGAWVGGRFNASGINGFGTYRGRPMDFVTTYSEKDTYAHMATETWPITTWSGFKGKLNFGLAIVPTSREGSLASIARGQQDWVWRAVATNLKRAGRGDSLIRVGWEYNIPDWPWYANASTVSQYKAAYRRVVRTMRSVAPGLKFEFGVNCGSSLRGSNDRLAALKLGYPGDDVVNLVGCDLYDWWSTHSTNDTTWRNNVLRNPYGPGLQDVVDFARKHGKGASFGEWGLARRSAGSGTGGGDNPYFISRMYQFFRANADVVAMESYFDEPDPYLANSLSTWQMPAAASKYRSLW
jgi:hypothetical protein